MDLKIEKVFTWLLLIFFIFLFFMTWRYGAKARLAPLFMLIPGIVLTGLQLWRSYRRPEAIKEEGVDEEDGESYEISAPFDQEMWMVGWFVAFAVAVWLVGFLVATPLFLILFLRFWAKESWLLALLLGGLTDVFIYFTMEWAFSIILYRGWMFR